MMWNVNRSSALTLLVTCVATFSVYCVLYNRTNYEGNRNVCELNEVIPREEMFELEANQAMRTNILFLKTHKTGSSTLQNILLRIGLRHSLDVMLPDRGHYLGYTMPLNNRTISVASTPVSGKFNIFACHSRYHENTRKFMNNDTVLITLLRDTPRHFESVYNFFHLDRRYGTTFEQLVSSLPNTSLDFTRNSVIRKGTNQLSHDLGFRIDRNTDDAAIRNFIQYIDEAFDFVMITEYFDICLVLLADLMRWPLEYVAYLPLMARVETKKSSFSPADEINLRQLNRVDALLYEYFLKKFRTRILQFGVDRLTENLRTLERLKDTLYVRCISGENRRGWGGTVSYNLKSDSDWECVYAAKGEISFVEEIRRRQRERFAKDRRFIDLVSAA